MQIRVYSAPGQAGDSVTIARADPPPAPDEPPGWVLARCDEWPNMFRADARAWACGEHTPAEAIDVQAVTTLAGLTLLATWTDGMVVLERTQFGQPLAHPRAMTYIGPVDGPVLPLHVQNLFRMGFHSRQVGVVGMAVLVLEAGQPVLRDEPDRRPDDVFVTDVVRLETWLSQHGITATRAGELPANLAEEYARELNDEVAPPELFFREEARRGE